ncbi:ATP-binding protein [Herbaspirillum lusitanum]|uniref:histidine kinase n=1 Tax=Herbaspirillum lusitanum TaxID=213312 RepID=A0ABW9A575_9BURK
MDGFKRKIGNSLQAQLSFWLSLVIVVTAIGGGFFSFRGAFNEAYEFQDDQLRQIAGLMEQQQPHTGLLITQVIEESADPESQVIVQVIGLDDKEITLKDEPLALPPDVQEGMHTMAGRRHTWRIFIRNLANSDRLIVTQRTDVRDEIASGNGWRTVGPFMVLMPLLLILVNVVIRYMLRPVTRLSAELDGRSESDLRTLDDVHVPREIRPFISSINSLLLRVGKSMDMQKRFVADAAHELRSPLTALSLQAENIRKIDLPPLAQERVRELRNGLYRMRSLLEQLLTMARSHETAAQRPPETISMEDMFKQILEDLMPMAEAKNLDIEVDSDPHAVFRGHLFDGVMVVKNLIDNAIRYTPPGGYVRLRASTRNGRLEIQVEDSGSGIPEVEMTRVFDPFYRILGSGESGSGLGLAIVKTILDRNRADIFLQNVKSDAGAVTGLRVTVLI